MTRLSAPGLPSRPPARATSLLALALFAVTLILLSATPAHAATRALIGQIPSTPEGGGAGQLKGPSGLAVNHTGAGGVSPGDLYVADIGNNRIDQFSAAGAFVRAFGFDVVAAGQHNTGATEQQTLTVKATGGKFALSFDGKTTGALGTGSWGNNSSTIALTSTSNGAFAAGQVITGGKGIKAGTTILSLVGSTITLSQPTEGTSGTNNNKSITGHNLPYNASAAEVETALNNLSSVTGAGGHLTVSGGPGDATGTSPYTITLGGSFAGNDVPELSDGEADPAGLQGAKSATVATTVPGGGIEICEAASAPLDACQAGPEKFAGPAGGMINPFGVAIDPTHGTLYVSDPNFNHRVDVFSATGAFEGAFGWQVDKNTPQAKLQFCTTATGCQAGESSAAAGGFPGGGRPTRTMAVDSGGDLYVPNPGNRRIDEFSPTFTAGVLTGVSFVRGIGWDVIPPGGAGDTGTGLETCTLASTCKQGSAGNGAGQFLAEGPSGVAVDAAGSIYAVNANFNCSATETCRVEKFNSDGTLDSNEFGPASGSCRLTSTSGSLLGGGTVDVAVDPAGQNLFALRKTALQEMKVCELTGSGGEVSLFPSAVLSAGTFFNAGLAAGGAERVYATAGESAIYILGPIPAPGVEILAASEVAQTSARLNGKVTIPAPGGAGFDTTYRFEYSADNGQHWTNVPVPDASLGSVAGTYPVSRLATELQPNLAYRFRLRATTGPSATSSEEAFTTTAAKPTITKTIALPVTGTTATLNAAVNPNNSPTTYHFEWGPCTTPATCSTSPYPNQAPGFDAFIGDGGAPLALAAKLSGLSLSSAYHFRLIAKNASGTTFGPEATFTTEFFPTACPREAIRQEMSGAGFPVSGGALPDCRAIELVSPPDKRPQGEVGAFGLLSQLDFQAAADGGSVLYPILSGLGDTAAGGAVRYRAARSAAGWQSARVSPDSTVPGLGEATTPSELIYANPDLSCQLVETFNPVTADTPPADVELGVTNLYLRKTDGSHSAYTLISNAVPANPGLPRSGSMNYYTVGGASPDCGRVIFQSPYRLLPGTPSGIYEWDHGTLRDAGLRPDGSAAPDTAIGALTGNDGKFRSESAVNAVAPDGRRLFFHATSNEGGDSGSSAVFVRKGLGVTVDASQSQTATPNNGAYYQSASPDGSHLFFVANYGLTGTPGAGLPTSCVYRLGAGSGTQGGGGQGCDLYDYDVEEEELTDLTATADPANSQGAEVQGVVAVSDKGDYVYFAARGRLVPGKGNTYAQNHEGEGFTNIYLAHDGALAYVATITFRDLARHCPISCGPAAGTGGGNLIVRADARSSQTTPDGRRLLFTSSANLTGYDSGGVEEAYLYFADSGATACVSCRPDGLPSVGNPPGGVPPVVEEGTEPIRSALTQVEESYRIPRSLSADGRRVFFSMPDVLAPGAVAGKRNLYEWVQGQVYLLATFDRVDEGFKDASASGDDVFVQSPDRLDPRYDLDTVRDLYDLRVGGGFPSPPSPPPPCDVATSACQGPESAPPAFLTPRGSGAVTGPGNPPPPPQACPKGKVKKQGKCVKKHHKKHPKRHQKRAARNRGGQK